MTSKDKHSKMENLTYTKIKMKNYLKSSEINLNEAINIFKFRTRMADFGENFRAGYDGVLCPLCIENFDDQSHAFKCRVIKNEIEIKGDINEIYGEKISKETAKTATKILKIRKELLENLDKWIVDRGESRTS